MIVRAYFKDDPLLSVGVKEGRLINGTRNKNTFSIERFSYDLERVFHGPMFGKIKTKLLLIPAKETPNMASRQFDCPITLLHLK